MMCEKHKEMYVLTPGVFINALPFVEDRQLELAITSAVGGNGFSAAQVAANLAANEGKN